LYGEDSLVHHRLRFFCGWLSGNGETKIQECAKKNKTSNRKSKINTLNFLENNPKQPIRGEFSKDGWKW
jgi:hypothetical protein